MKQLTLNLTDVQYKWLCDQVKALEEKSGVKVTPEAVVKHLCERAVPEFEKELKQLRNRKCAVLKMVVNK